MKKYYSYTAILLLSFSATAQNVGIGVTNPTRAKLEVNGVAGVFSRTVAVFGSDGAGVSFQRSKPAIGFNQYRDNPSGYGIFMNYGFGAVQHFDPLTSTMTFEMMSSGNIGQTPAITRKALMLSYSGSTAIGNTDFEGSLTVNRGNHNATAYFFGSTHHSAFNLGSAENTYIRAGKDGGAVIINDIPNGKVSFTGFVGINTATPVVPMEIRQTNNMALALVEPTTFGNWDFNIDQSSGRFQLNANGATVGWFSAVDAGYGQVSDIRLKSKILELSPVLKNFMQLQPVSYKMNDEQQGESHTGFIAQDVKKLFPELVTINNDTANGYATINNLHLVNYDGIPVVTIKAIQEQQIIIDKQQLMINDLRKKLTGLKAAMEN